MGVVVAVVSWNTRDLLLRCLESLLGEVSEGRGAVWVVDNGSSDGSAAAVRSRAPWATVIEADANLGFGAAVNLVAREAQGEWLLAANADVALEPGALQAMAGAGADPRVGAVAPRLIAPDGRTQHSVYPLPTVGFTLAFNLGLAQLSRGTADRLCLEGAWDPERPREVPWAIGACLLLRRAAFDAVGGFDERQWMYAEDLDLGWRLRRHGWVTRYEPRARVLHQVGASAQSAFGPDPRPVFMAATYAMLARRQGRIRQGLTGAINVAGAAVRVAWATPLAVVSRRWRARRADNLGWLRAHREGLRRARGTLADDARAGNALPPGSSLGGRR